MIRKKKQNKKCIHTNAQSKITEMIQALEHVEGVVNKSDLAVNFDKTQKIYYRYKETQKIMTLQ